MGGEIEFEETICIIGMIGIRKVIGVIGVIEIIGVIGVIDKSNGGK